MVFEFISPSNTTLSRTLEFASLLLENAHNTNDSKIALKSCEDAKKHLDKVYTWGVKDQSVRHKFSEAYFELGKMYQSLERRSKADASFGRAKKWDRIQGVDIQPGSSKPSKDAESNDNADKFLEKTLAALKINATLSPRQMFSHDVSPPIAKYDLPEPDEHITSTPQLVYCLGLLSNSTTPAESIDETVFDEAERTWLHAMLKDLRGQKKLRMLAANMIVEFINDELKQETTVTEVVHLTPVLEKDIFRRLLAAFVDGIEKPVLLEVHLLEGLLQMVKGARPGYLDADDLVQILSRLSTRLQNTHLQSTTYVYRLTLAVSHALDAMADSQVTGLNRVQLHEPLSAYLEDLKSSTDPYLVYQAAYAYQALQYVPDDESPWKATLRRTGKIATGLSGIVSATKALDLSGVVQALGNIQEGLPAAEVVQFFQEAYRGVTSLTKSGQTLRSCLKESFIRAQTWYPALRGIDVLLQDGQFNKFERLTYEVPCRRDPAFQWGLCQRLGNLAENLLWDDNTRYSAVEFLGEVYKDDEKWGYHANVKQWVLKILFQLEASLKSTLKDRVGSMLQELEADGDEKKQALYQDCRSEGYSSYPMTVALPTLVSSTLLGRAFDIPEVEDSLRNLQSQRLKEQDEVVYIPPQAKPNLRSSDDALFGLMEKVEDFLSSDRKVFLVLGDSGAGKSTFDRELEKELWRIYEEKYGRIPLYINLPAIDRPEQNLIGQQLRNLGFTQPQIKELKSQREFILICDGYDESQQTHNLYVMNRLNQPGEWRAQMVISCRSEYVGSDYEYDFQPTDRNCSRVSENFQEAVIAPFSVAQIQDYIRQYVPLNRTLWKETDYRQALEHIPNLQDLVKNPFLLTLALEVLPGLVDPGHDFSSTKITKVALYDEFVERWLKRGKNRLSEKTLSDPERSAFESLKREGFTYHCITFLKDLATAIYEKHSGKPLVEYRRSIDNGTWKTRFFARSPENQLLLEAIPLSCIGNQYWFAHKSLLEYCVARAVYEPRLNEACMEQTATLIRRGSMSSVMSFESQGEAEEEVVTATPPILDTVLARKNFVGEPSILQFLSERVQQERLFKQQLLEVIEYSKTDKAASKAASNAITILIKAGVQFNGSDLQGIQIPGADLSYGVFDSAQLQGADLRKTNFRCIWLREANLSGAMMTGVQFGELPLLPEATRVYSCVYSPDGQTFAAGLESGNISIRETPNWKIIQTLRGHSGRVSSVAYSPKGDRIVSGSYDKAVRLWNVETGTCIRTLNGHSRLVRAVAYSPKGDRTASGSSDGTVRLWDIETGTCLRTINGHSGSVHAIAFSPKRDQIASGSSDWTVRLWDIETGTCLRIMDGHGDSVNCVAYSPKSDQIASGSDDSTVRLWETETGTCLRTISDHKGWVLATVYSPKGDQIATGGYDETVRMWDVETGKCLHTFSGHVDSINCVAYSPKGYHIASGSDDSKVRLWDVESSIYRHTVGGHGGDVNCLANSPKGDQIASGSDDRTVRLWDIETGTCDHTLRGHRDWVRAVVYSPKGGQIATGSRDWTVKLWNVEAGTCLGTLNGHGGGVNCVAYSPKGDRIASGSDDITVWVWDVGTRTGLHILNGHSRMVHAVAYSPQGNRIASGSTDGTVRLWDVEVGTCLHILNGSSGAVRAVAYSLNGAQVIAGGDDMKLRLWDVDTGTCLHTLSGHVGWVRAVAYSPSGSQVASGGSDKKVRLWDVSDGRCEMILKCCEGSVTSVAWQEDFNGVYLLTGSRDKSVRRWRIIKQEGGHKASLYWSSSHEVLAVSGSSIQDVHGLTHVNEMLLRQRGALGTAK